jgi:serine/threonine protein kinase
LRSHRYLHHKRYFDEYEDEWKESVVHRDLKPDNMLVTSKSVLKLTDFGEARSAELDLTMTAVGTPIFICPEIIRSERYDTKADSYSYGICLVAMMQIEKVRQPLKWTRQPPEPLTLALQTVQDFFFNAVMRQMGKTKRQGIGLGHLNRNIEMGWRPTLPQEFYPSMIALIWRCWDDDPNVRPDFDEITQLLMGPIADEVRSNQEPVFGSGMLIKQMDQREMDLADDGSGVVAKNLYDAVMRQLKERDEELARLQGKGDMETYSAVTRKEGGGRGGRGLG